MEHRYQQISGQLIQNHNISEITTKITWKDASYPKFEDS